MRRKRLKHKATRGRKVQETTEQRASSPATNPSIKTPDENDRAEVLEQVSYCLGLAKRLVDIELGRVAP